jgi:Flp pilus assembly protein TadD
MRLFDIFKKTAKEWFQEAQKVWPIARNAIIYTANWDVQRLREGIIGSAKDGENARLLAKLDKQVLYCLDKALHLDPSYAPALFAKGEIMLYQNDIKEAISYFDKVFLSEPDFPSAYYLKAEALVREERFDEALACYQKAVELNANDAESLMGKARILRRNGKEKDADECAAKAKMLDPSLDQAIRFSKSRWEELSI